MATSCQGFMNGKVYRDTAAGNPKNHRRACLPPGELYCYPKRKIPVAVISELHSNKESLSKVLADIESEGINDIFALGDLIGYGPHPRFVVETAINCKLSLMGNHDEAVLKEAYGSNP